MVTIGLPVRFGIWPPITWSSLQWRHDGSDSVSSHQPHECLLNHIFKGRSKKTSKLCVTGLCAGNSPGPVNSPHKWPVTRKMFPFDDVIMDITHLWLPGLNTGRRNICCKAFWAPETGGNLHWFLNVAGSPLEQSAKGRPIPAVRTVQGYRERVYKETVKESGYSHYNVQQWAW